MEPLADRYLEQPDFLLRTLMLFPHPSTSLWRAIEAREIWKEFRVRELGTPVLDIGCGDGRFSTAVFDSGRIDVGVDISPSAVSMAKTRANYTHLMTGDGARLPFQDGVFETVFSNSVLEHIPNIVQVLPEVRRILKRGGVFVFTVPSPNFSTYLFLSSLFQSIPLLGTFGNWYSNQRNILLSHNNIYPIGVWKSWLRAAGFPLVQTRFCLSKATIQVWDVMALIIYVFRLPLNASPRLLTYALKGSKKLRVFVLKLILRRFYLSSNVEGADMIIVAGTQETTRICEAQNQKN